MAIFSCTYQVTLLCINIDEKLVVQGTILYDLFSQSRLVTLAVTANQELI
jgi:hypothetical protein